MFTLVRFCSFFHTFNKNKENKRIITQNVKNSFDEIQYSNGKGGYRGTCTLYIVKDEKN